MYNSMEYASGGCESSFNTEIAAAGPCLPSVMEEEEEEEEAAEAEAGDNRRQGASVLRLGSSAAPQYSHFSEHKISFIYISPL